MTKAEIGRALARIRHDVVDEAAGLVGQYRAAESRLKSELIRDAIASPARARAKVSGWIADYDAAHSAGAAATLLGECLAAAGANQTLAEISADLDSLEAAAQTVADALVARTITDDEAATLIDAAVVAETDASYSYRMLTVPAGWTDPFGKVYPGSARHQVS